MPAVAAWPYKRSKAVIQTQIEPWAAEEHSWPRKIGQILDETKISCALIFNLLVVLRNLQLNIIVAGINKVLAIRKYI